MKLNGKNKKATDTEEIKDNVEETDESGTATGERKAEQLDNPLLDTIEKLSKENDDLKSKVNDYMSSWQRERADFDNFKKRSAAERQELYKIVAEETIAKFLDVVDNLERALEMGRKSDNMESLITGVEMVHKQMLDVMGSFGVTKIEAVGKEFDPNFHEAVQTEAKEDVPDGTIIEEYRKGYMGSARAIRPSMVKVSKKD